MHKRDWISNAGNEKGVNNFVLLVLQKDNFLSIKVWKFKNGKFTKSSGFRARVCS